MKKVTVLDFGMGNLRSVAKAFERVETAVSISERVDPTSDVLVVPGQGHFGSCVINLGARLDSVRDWIESGRPYFGICLGLQVLFDRSEESPEKGLGLLDGEVVRFQGNVKVPHIGWNVVTPTSEAKVLSRIEPGTRFYFVHSYFPKIEHPAALAEHGEDFCCAVERDNIVATQFHPEKSGDAGARLLTDYVGAL